MSDPNDLDLELSRVWNDLTETGHVPPSSLDPETENLLRRLESSANASLPDSARERVWRRTLNQIEQIQPREERMSVNVMAGPRERISAGSSAVPPARSGWRWRGSQFAAATLLVAAMGIGYLTFERFNSDNGRVNTIPAALQTGDDQANNPFIGVWQLVDTPNDPLGDGIGSFHADGSYSEVNVKITSLGMWRLTGENTIEVFTITSSIGWPDDPGYYPGIQQYYVTYTYDPATDTISGFYTPTILDGQGEYLMGGGKYSQRGTRVSFETILNPATPTP